MSVYPGETFQVSVASVGQRNGIVPSTVNSHLYIGRLMTSQYIQGCPPGFSLENSSVSCVCDEALKKIYKPLKYNKWIRTDIA